MAPRSDARPTNHQRNKQSLDYVVRTGIAGGIAGCVAKTVVAPLDRVKILFQASNPEFQRYTGSWTGAFKAAQSIYKDGGMRGLFQGHSATLLRIFPYAGIKFMAYDQIHAYLMPTLESETHARRFLAGSLSGTLSVFCTYPLEVIRVRLAYHIRSPTATTKRPGFLYAASYIYHEGLPQSSTRPSSSHLPPRNLIFAKFPLLKFYRGFSATIIGMVPYAGTSFLVWGSLRSALLPKPKPGEPRKPTPIADLCIGAIAGAISQTASYPFEVIRRRMQVGGVHRPDNWMRWGETVRAIWSAGGWRGFYVGLSIGYLKVVPMTAVSYAVWEGMKRVLGV